MRRFSIVLMLFVSMLLSQGSLAELLSGDIAVSSSSTTDITTTTEQYPPSNEAETKSEPSIADNAFVITCAILVILMSVPGIALFYGGLVRSKNVLSILQQCMVVFGICFLLWFIVGYTWAFGSTGDANSWFSLIIGSSDKLFLSNITTDSVSGTLSEYNFVVFQGTRLLSKPIKFTNYANSPFKNNLRYSSLSDSLFLISLRLRSYVSI